MPSKTKKKKKPGDIVTPQEQLARAQVRSLTRATQMQRRVKSLTRSLEQMTTSTDGALMAFASVVAARVGYEFTPKQEQV